MHEAVPACESMVILPVPSSERTSRPPGTDVSAAPGIVSAIPGAYFSVVLRLGLAAAVIPAMTLALGLALRRCRRNLRRGV